MMSLEKQEANITEPGEKEATAEILKNYHELLADPNDPSNFIEIRQSIYQVQDLNNSAIYRKNAVAQNTSKNAKL